MSNSRLVDKINYEQLLLKLKLSLPKKSVNNTEKDKNVSLSQNSNLRFLSVNNVKKSKPYLFEINQDNILTTEQPYKLQYKPKRLVKISNHSINSPLKKVGSLTDCKKLLGAAPINLQMPILNSDSKNTLYKSNMEFKNKYIIKFAQLSSGFENILNKNIDHIPSNKKNSFNNAFNKILNTLKSQINLFFYDNNNIFEKNCKINSNELLNSNIIDTSPYQISNPENSNNNIYNTIEYEVEKNVNRRDLPSAKTNYTNNNIINDKQISRNNVNLLLSNNDSKSSIISNRNNNVNFSAKESHNIISYFYDIGFYCNKVISSLFEELIESKDKTNKLNNKINISENKINEKEKKIEELSKFVNKNDVNKLISDLRNEAKFDQMKKDFKEKANSYIVLNYKLEQEIRTLTKLLDRNQEYVNKCQVLEKEIENYKKMNDELKFMYGKELHDKEVINAVSKYSEEELLADIEKKDKIIKELKKEITELKTNEINNKAKIMTIQNKIDERNENIFMLNEEFEWSFNEMKILQGKNAQLQKELEYFEEKVISFEGNENMKEMVDKTEEQSNELQNDTIK